MATSSPNNLTTSPGLPYMLPCKMEPSLCVTAVGVEYNQHHRALSGHIESHIITSTPCHVCYLRSRHIVTVVHPDKVITGFCTEI